MPTPRETILAALHARLSALPATALRGEALPERVPAEGLLILRDGEPGEPEVTLSPLRYHYQHRGEIEAVVQGPDRDAAFDTLIANIGAALDPPPRIGNGLPPGTGAPSENRYLVLRSACPRQRRSNEKTDGLLRQSFPKGTDLSGISQTALNDVARLMNQRPRKTLGWKTPEEAMGTELAAFKSIGTLET